MDRQFTIVIVAGTLAAALIGLGRDQDAVNAQGGAPQTARGIVFHDANGNRRFDAGEQPLPAVRVSNGRDIVTTGADGRYELTVEEDTALFVIKPRGWRTPVNDHQLPQFYYLHKPQGSPHGKFSGVAPTGPLPESIDFPLAPQEEPDDFQAILFGDTQPRNQQEVDWIAHDVVEGLIGTEAAFGVTLGDIVFDDLSVFEPLNRTIALIGIPWYNVIGNHDINTDAHHRRHANETYESNYGPSYYAFDYGPVHFLVLDNIEWTVNSETGKGGWRGGIGPSQLEFIQTDLAQIPDDQLVVLMMHVPLTGVHDRHGLYRLIEQRPFCISISGHTHTHEHVWITKEDGWEGPQPHHHIVNVTVCGSWWSGAPDERGIPHTTMADGGPNGYSVISFNGAEYRLDYHAAGRPADYQLEIDGPEVIAAAEAADASLFVNVFNGSEKTEVKMRVDDGEWQPLTKTLEPDPKYLRTFDAESAILEQTKVFRQLPKPHASTHLWKAPIPPGLTPGTHRIDVEATDHWGRTFSGHRVLRVE
ncbi:MAG: calcineurin-like phosphoesterase family protein [Planctomycetaceae bacterium]|nr:calcineurin-like phosphoesterase family protein [Planctomycetaceae bacterium]